MIQSIVHRWSLLSPIFRVANPASKKLVIFRGYPRIDPIFYFFIRPEVLISQAVPLIETSDSQREQRLENTAGGVGIPISTFPNMSWPLSQHGVEHAAKSFYRVSRCIAIVCLSMLGLNASIAFDTDRLWLFQSVLTVHNTLRRAGPTKYRAWPWSLGIFGLAVDVEAWPGTPHDFLRLGLS